MLPLHYAAFFDAAPILRVLLKASSARGTETCGKLSLSLGVWIKEGYLSVNVHAYLICYFISDVDIRCKEFDNGTSLHIAASNLCLEGAKCLVSDFVELKKMSSETEHKGQMASFSKFLLANELFLLANNQMTTVFVEPWLN